jgi:16S rRNA (adenine1518-N6/adenine1519-N6)-dimethyltransferase
MQFNKAYSQCFLMDNNILRKISRITSLKDRVVAEVGAGMGNLTKHIVSEQPKDLTLYEIDGRFIIELQQYGTVIHGDCLLRNIIADVIITNLPYSISTPFCKALILQYQWNETVILIQKEFAHKLMDIHNILGFVLNCIASIKIISDVNSKCFKPVPAVVSTIVHIVKKPHNYNVYMLWKFADSIFSHARKKLGTVYEQYAGLRPAQLNKEQLLELYNIWFKKYTKNIE